MKHLFTFLFFCFTLYTSSAQVGIGTSTPDPAAALDITATDKGLLIPRVTRANRPGSAGMVAPTPGLMIYQTDSDPGFYVYDGTSWDKMVKKSDQPGATFFQGIRKMPADFNTYPLSGRLVSFTPITYDTLAISPDILINAAQSQVTLTKAGTYLIKYQVNPISATNPYFSAAIRVNFKAIWGTWNSDYTSNSPKLSGELIAKVEANSTVDVVLNNGSSTINVIQFQRNNSLGASLTIIRLN
ncbi:BclA C-terminal domain-containing protein [Siphonobacter curvatus]|uniref:BclA C-terminal domain-containing protein n=1 Tax=Siphonobacter curvatus TaxID=2094562 RepID=A0A2S7IQI3_9BACT|nr:hypothetical protein [Siphonobacter curvatus]PQA59942.1 hypothetical protein C5O19_10060 [Siphonobacter curvatus]